MVVILDDIMYKHIIIVEHNLSPETLEEILIQEKVEIWDEMKEPLKDQAGLCYTFDNQVILVRLKDIPKDPITIAVLNHELSHATISVLRTAGLNLTEASEEAYTYHTEWLIREVLNAFWQKKKSVVNSN